MNCPNCNKSLPEGSAFCSECGTRLSDSKKIVVRFKESIANVNFLVCAILISIVAVVSGINAASYVTANDIWSAILPGASAVCAVISAIGAWSIVISKTASPTTIRIYNAYNVIMVIMTTITCIFSGIVSFILFVGLVVGGIILAVLGNSATEVINKVVEALDGQVDMSSEEIVEFLKNGGIFIAIFGAVLIFVIMFLSINGVLLYKNNSRYIKEVAESLENDSYSVKKYPKARPWIFGVVFAALGIALVAFNALTGIVIMVEGGMLIASVLWFKTVHKWDRVVEVEEKPVKKPAAEKTKAPVEKKAKKVKEPKVKEPKVKDVKVEEPKVETPKVEEPVVEEHKVETPKVEAPVVEEPKVEEPIVEEPKVEEVKVEESAPESAEETDKTESEIETTEAEPVVEQEEKTEPEAEVEATETEPEAVETEAVEEEPEAVKSETEESKEQN
jgi:predicted nucleic acid-binding Zn ribbon protein